MKSPVEYVLLAGLLLTTACQAAGGPSPAGTSSAPNVMQTVNASGLTPLPTQTIAPFSNASGPTATTAPPVTWNGDGPLFVAIIQSTGMGGQSVEKQQIDVGLVAFTYDLDNHILILHPTIPPASLDGQVVIGLVTEVETPGAIYVKREILRSPSQPRFMKIVGAEAGTDTLDFIYDGQSYSLLAGKSLSFDKTGATAGAATVTTLITNHGRLEGAQSLPSGPQP